MKPRRADPTRPDATRRDGRYLGEAAAIAERVSAYAPKYMYRLLVDRCARPVGTNGAGGGAGGG